MATKELKNKAVNLELRALIAETVQEVLEDPDFGLELRPEIRKKLLAIKHKNQRTISFEEIKRKYR